MKQTAKEILAYISGYTVEELKDRCTEALIQPYDAELTAVKYAAQCVSEAIQQKGGDKMRTKEEIKIEFRILASDPTIEERERTAENCFLIAQSFADQCVQEAIQRRDKEIVNECDRITELTEKRLGRCPYSVSRRDMTSHIVQFLSTPTQVEPSTEISYLQ